MMAQRIAHTQFVKNKYNIIDLPINLGLAGGFQAGAKYAYLKGYDCFIQFDADGQHLPEYIDKMLKKLDEGYDIVIGSRFVDEKSLFLLECWEADLYPQR